MKKRKFHYTGRLVCILLALCMAVAILPTTVFAGNGPSTGEYSFAWVHLCSQDEEGYFDEFHNIWSRDGEDIEMINGISYNEETNTLTLTDVNMPDYFIVTNEMGDDFKIELIGDNRLLFLYTYGYGWGGSLELTGNGNLTLNEKKTAECPITLEAEYSDAVFVADSTVTLTIYKSSSDSNIVENITTKRPENAIQFNGKTDDAGITAEEIQKYKTLPVMSGVSEYDMTFDEYYTKDGKKYAIPEMHHVDDNGEFTDTFWGVYELFEIDHPTVPTGMIAVDLYEELYEAPETLGYTKHEGEFSANALNNGSSNTDIVKNTATGKEYAYVVDWAENTYTLYELVTELDGFDNGWGAGDVWYATPAEPTVTGSVDDELPDGYEYISLGGSGFYLHIATGGSGDVFTQTPTDEPTDVKYGDANGDGNIDMIDVLLIRKYIAKQPVKPDLTASDVTDDGNIDMLDVPLIRKYIAKQPVTLGPKK